MPAVRSWRAQRSRSGVSNGDVGIVLPSATDASALRAYFLDGDSQRSVAVSRLAHIETAYAMTVHKSQGSEFAHVALVLPPGAGSILPVNSSTPELPGHGPT